MSLHRPNKWVPACCPTGKWSNQAGRTIPTAGHLHAAQLIFKPLQNICRSTVEVLANYMLNVICLLTCWASSGVSNETNPNPFERPWSDVATFRLRTLPKGWTSSLKSASVISSPKFFTYTLVNFFGWFPSCSRRSLRDIHLVANLQEINLTYMQVFSASRTIDDIFRPYRSILVSTN